MSDAFRVRRCGSGGAENLRTLPSAFLYLNLPTLLSRTAALFRGRVSPGMHTYDQHSVTFIQHWQSQWNVYMSMKRLWDLFRIDLHL